MGIFRDLIAVLKTEAQLLEELIELSTAKQNQINNAQEVAKLAGQEQELLKQVEAWDRERTLLFDALAPGQSLEEWLLGLSEEKQRIAAPIITDLVQKVALLQSLNDLNQQLLAESLAYVQFSLNVLLGDDGAPTYVRTGAGSSGKTIFDRKV